MNSNIRIAIVEDELLIAEKIKMQLMEMGYWVVGVATTYSQAIELIDQFEPDIVLLDIQLAGEKDGIDVAKYVREHKQKPFIFLTANSDWSTVERAKLVKPSAYIVKPFTREDLFTSIEITLANYTPSTEIPPTDRGSREFTFIKEGYTYRKLMFAEIRFVESEGNYVNIFTEGNKKIMVRSKLEDISKRLNSHELFRVHRSYIVNVKHIDGVSPTEVAIGNRSIPIGKTYKEPLFKLLGID